MFSKIDLNINLTGPGDIPGSTRPAVPQGPGGGGGGVPPQSPVSGMLVPSRDGGAGAPPRLPPPGTGALGSPQRGGPGPTVRTSIDMRSSLTKLLQFGGKMWGLYTKYLPMLAKIHYATFLLGKAVGIITSTVTSIHKNILDIVNSLQLVDPTVARAQADRQIRLLEGLFSRSEAIGQRAAEYLDTTSRVERQLMELNTSIVGLGITFIKPILDLFAQFLGEVNPLLRTLSNLFNDPEQAFKDGVDYLVLRLIKQTFAHMGFSLQAIDDKLGDIRRRIMGEDLDTLETLWDDFNAFMFDLNVPHLAPAAQPVF